ncbi:MAG: (d)CMP kinase [Prevotellaceae bacterium]|nr:(d)CMP kinase [Candidatus Colivivens caballi]
MSNQGKIIVAIDGHSSCGKSTMAKWLARQVGYIYVDTGAMYRTITLFAMRNGLITSDAKIDQDGLKEALDKAEISFTLDPDTNLPLACLNGEVVEKEIRGMEVSSLVSPIAALPFVREKLTVQQKAMGEKKGIVMDGRDIGTAVFPQAELKVFVTASAEVRARRRFLELQEKGEQNLDFDEILKNVQERDYIDSHREMNPLRQADDARVLDNSDLTIDEQNQLLLKMFNETIQNSEELIVESGEVSNL